MSLNNADHSEELLVESIRNSHRPGSRVHLKNNLRASASGRGGLDQSNIATSQQNSAVPSENEVGFYRLLKNSLQRDISKAL
jgi:hypothetical protein